jgi:hypothetical protein
VTKMSEAMHTADGQSLLSRVAAVVVLLVGVLLAAGLCGASPLLHIPY